MKKFITLFFCIISYAGNAQNWKVITPFNNTSTIRDMEVTPNGTLYVIAQPNNTFKSADGGNSWSAMNFDNYSGYPSDITMLDNNNGFMITSHGRLYKTTDGWQTSVFVNGASTVTNNRVYFFNDNLGFLVGYRRFIRKTTDGGLTWTGLSIPADMMASGEDIKDIHFVNENIGFVVNTAGEVLKTLDQGETWTKILLQQNGYDLNKLLFVNENTGFAVGALGEIYRTIDQGETWTLTNTEVGVAYDIRLNNGILYVVGGSRAFIKSSDFGETWSPKQTVVESGASTGYLRLYAVTFLNNQIITAGEDGKIFKAENPNGTAWSLFYEPIWGNVATTALQFTDENKGLLVGSGNSQSAIYYTDNGGYRWQRKALAGSGWYKAIDLKTNGKGLMVGQAGYATTTDYGQTWSNLTPIQPNTSYTKCWLKGNNDFFIGTNPGAPVNDGLIKSNTNTNTWTQFTDMPRISEIKFFDDNLGYAGTGVSGFTSQLWKTTDGGVSWTELESYTGGNIKEIQIIDQNQLFVTNITNHSSVSYDGGASWISLMGSNFPTRFHFFDNMNAYGIDINTQNVYKTEDGGTTWEVIISDDNSLCGIEHLAWFEDKIVYAGGLFKVCILNISETLQVNPAQLDTVKRIVIYPNPAKNILNISEYVKTVTITDISGKTLATYDFVNQIDISNYTHGIYIASLTTENGAKTVLKFIKE
ncbi:MAG: YCF48-related protein [Candidatus Kapabacteria bacterium]|jgi:photosystem II stability/assembly factor-like uncharacterized protein|nr:YCF48-related protein [Candidatus Kapabacteria bacterium]